MENEDLPAARPEHSGLAADFTLEELFQSLSEEQLKQSDEGLTSEEWAKFFKRGRDWGRRLVRRMLNEGLMVRGTRYIENISGVMQPVKVFRFTEEAKAKYTKSKGKDARRR